MEDVLPTGTRLGRYEIVRRLATGGMAEIYLARMSGPAGFAKHVVLKRILPSYARDDEFVRMFYNEARYAATLDHPNIAHVYDLGEDRGLPYFTMEYLHGDDCRGLIVAASNRKQPIPLAHALTIVIGAAAGCHFAHEMVGEDGRPLGLVHRDISPSNVVVTYAGAIKIVDFGIAKATNVEAVTAAGATKGKLAYMAPEQGRSEPVDRRADVYALGVLLYELTTLRRAFLGETEAQVLWHVISGEWQRPAEVVLDYPPALTAIVEKAMAFERADRYATARELQQALEAFAHDHGLTLGGSHLGELLDELVGPKVEPWRVTDRVESRPATPLPLPAEALADTAVGIAVATPVPRPIQPGPQVVEAEPPARSAHERAVDQTRSLAPSQSDHGPVPGTAQPEADAPPRRPSATRRAGPPPLRAGRGTWILGGILATGGAGAVGYVAYTSTQRTEPPVVLVAERGSATLEQPADAGAAPVATAIDAGPAIAVALDAGGRAHAVDAGRGPAPPRSVRPAASDPLSQAFARRTGQINACFAAHPADIGAAPQLVLRFEIDAAGTPTAVAVDPAALASTALGACILDVARGTRFPAQPEPVAFRIPLALHKQGGTP